TTTIEVMTVIDGALAVRLPGAKSPTVYRAGESFEVGAGETFHLTVSVKTAYHCLYVSYRGRPKRFRIPEPARGALDNPRRRDVYIG
ncbi:MAG: pyrimidine/purine nucleoside phosphorylase, partial [Candidatus Bipolaricaulota bacterium]|nr:pyrimidine/purine nucleoside phosphorylase [Candidatus Bipolaricaulota bacterium]